jgi:pilus assembly protein CpaE
MGTLILDNMGSTPDVAQASVAVAIEATDLFEETQACLRDMPVRVVLEAHELGNWAAFLQRLESARPEVVLFDITQPPRPLEDCVRAIRAAVPSAMLVVLHQTADPETILTAMRAGAHEFLYPPLNGNLRKAIERRSEQRGRARESARPPGRVIGFLSVKGGCGATTIACHLAAELGRLSVQRADHSLLVDLDLESGIVGFLMKVKSPYSLLDAVQNLHRLDLSYWNALVSSEWPGLEILPAPAGYIAKETVPGEHLQKVLAFARANYSWTIADLGSTLDLATVTVMDEIDEAFLVTTLEVPALHQAKQMVQKLMNGGYGNRLRVILNRTPQRPDVTAEELERILGLPIDTMLPNDYYALYDAFCKGKLLPPGSHLNQRVASLAMRLAGVPAEKSKRRFGLFG